MTLAPRRAPPSPTGHNRPPSSDLTTYVRTKTHPWDVGTTPIRHPSLYLTFIHSLILLSCCVSLLFTSCNCIFLGLTLHCIPLPAFSPLQAVAPGYSDIFTSLSSPPLSLSLHIHASSHLHRSCTRPLHHVHSVDVLGHSSPTRHPRPVLSITTTRLRLHHAIILLPSSSHLPPVSSSS